MARQCKPWEPGFIPPHNKQKVVPFGPDELDGWAMNDRSQKCVVFEKPVGSGWAGRLILRGDRKGWTLDHEWVGNTRRKREVLFTAPNLEAVEVWLAFECESRPELNRAPWLDYYRLQNEPLISDWKPGGCKSHSRWLRQVNAYAQVLGTAVHKIGAGQFVTVDVDMSELEKRVLGAYCAADVQVVHDEITVTVPNKTGGSP